jgi:hypothetical protein
MVRSVQIKCSAAQTLLLLYAMKKHVKHWPSTPMKIYSQSIDLFLYLRKSVPQNTSQEY